jgi:hypothetical protein
MSATVEILGHHYPKQTLMIGGVAVVVILALLSRNNAGKPTAVMPMVAADNFAGPGAIPDQSGQNEYLKIIAEANLELMQLTSANKLQEKQLDYQYALQAGVNPGLNKQCISWDTWFSLPAQQRKNINQQIKNGKLIAQPGIDGYCTTPTQIGFRGSEPLVSVDTDSGFFSSGQTIRGPAGSFNPAGSMAPQTGLNSLLSDALRAYQLSMGGGYGRYY